MAARAGSRFAPVVENLFTVGARMARPLAFRVQGTPPTALVSKPPLGAQGEVARRSRDGGDQSCR